MKYAFALGFFGAAFASAAVPSEPSSLVTAPSAERVTIENVPIGEKSTDKAQNAKDALGKTTAQVATPQTAKSKQKTKGKPKESFSHKLARFL